MIKQEVQTPYKFRPSLENELRQIMDGKWYSSPGHCDRIFAEVLLELLKRTSNTGSKP